MRRIALVTYDRAPDLTEDDQRLLAPLRELGVEGEAVVWTDPTVDWTTFELAVLRSTWDYHLRFAEFTAWLRKIESLGLPLMNPLPLVLWNSRKTYLRDLENRGVRIVPTVWVDRDQEAMEVPEEWGDDLVVKPVVSADGHDTYRIARRDLASLEERIHQSGALIQPFCREIVDEGEWSLIFIEGRYSHSILKVPQAGEFRVQETWGGGPIAAEAPASLVRSAGLALEAAGTPATFARVDGIRRGDAFLLIELELIEPALYLEFGPGSESRLAAAIARVLG